MLAERSQHLLVDGVTPEAYADGLRGRLTRLGEAIVAGTYRPSRLVRMHRDKPSGGVRRLSIPVVEDRIVLELLRHALEPGIEPPLTRAAFAYRPGRSARAAVDAVLGRIDAGATWVALGDIREFFDTVRLDDVIEAARKACSDPAVLRLLETVLRGHALRPGRGLAQGYKRRAKVAKALEKLGRRVQYSVFLLHPGTPGEVAGALARLIDPKADNVRIHVLCATCEGKAVLLGQAREKDLPVGFRVV